MDYETPKFQKKTPSGSGLTSPLNRGIRQGFSRFEPTGLEKCAGAKPGKRDCLGLKQCKFEALNMEFETPKFQAKTPSGSALTNPLNMGTQQGFSRSEPTGFGKVRK